MKVPKGIQLSPAGVKDICNLHAKPDFDLMDYPLSMLRQKFSHGLWHGLLAKADNEVVGYAFFTKHEIIFGGSKLVALNLPRQSVYLFRTFVHPSARNMGIGKALVGMRLKLCGQQGLTEAYAAVNNTNMVSIKNCKTLGGKIIGSVFFLKTRFFNWVICSPGLLISGLKSKASFTPKTAYEILPY